MKRLAVLLAVTGCHASHPAPGDIAFTDVTVVSMTSDTELPHQTVFVVGGRIAAIVPSSTAVPRGTRVFDGRGKWLMPGLADMHVHIWNEDDLAMYVAAGVTTVRNMWGIPEHVRWRDELASGKRFGPTLVTAGDLIDGDPPDWQGSVVLTNPAQADALVVAQKAAGYDFIKSVNRLTRPAYEALAAATKKHGMELAGHVPESVGVAGALDAGQRSIEHLDGYLAALVPGELPSDEDYQQWLAAVQAGFDRTKLPALAARTAVSGTWNCATLIAYNRSPGLYDPTTSTWLSLVPAATRAGWLHRYAAPTSAEDKARLRKNSELLGTILAELYTMGAPLLVGTDTGLDFEIPGEALHDEIELEVAAGVPRARVLRAATADAARFLGHPHDGVIEVGARADLLLVSTDPLTAPLPLVPDGVVLRGQWIPRADLDARLAEVAKRAAAPPAPWPYVKMLDGVVVGQERFTRSSGVTRGESADLAEDTLLTYELASDSVALGWTYHSRTLALRGKVAANELVVTGTDLQGKPVDLRVGIADSFLSTPGLGGTLELALHVADLKPGEKRELSSIELTYAPIDLETTTYRVERRPDRGRLRVYSIAATVATTTTTSELVLDGTGIVEQTGDVEIRRR